MAQHRLMYFFCNCICTDTGIAVIMLWIGITTEFYRKYIKNVEL